MAKALKYKNIPEKYVLTKSDRAFVDSGGQWVPEKGRFVEQFIETYGQPSRGFGADKVVKLLPWQRDDLIYPLFSWIKPDGYRRFREGCFYIPRQNGKSFLASQLALYMLIGDGEAGPYVVVSAVSGAQTKVVYDEIHNAINNNDELAACLYPTPSNREIRSDFNNGLLKGLSNDSWSHLGRPPHFFCADEFSFWGNYKPYVAVKTGAGSRKQPLLLTISTSGTDRTTPAFEQWKYAEAITSGSIVDTTFFPLIYAAKPEDDIHDEATWRKCNPSIGASLDVEEIRTWSERAKRSKVEELNFCQFRLNFWCATVNQFLNLDSLAHCVVGKEDWPDLSGQDAYVFIDTSTTTDLTGVVALIPFNGRYFVDHHAFCCKAGVEKSEAQNLMKYSLFEHEGTLTVHDGNSVDLNDVRDHVRNLASKYNVRAIGIDPSHNANDTMIILSSEGYPIEPVPQNANYTNEPMRRLNDMVLNGKLAHQGDTLFNWQAQNLESRKNTRDQLFWKKPSNDAKIDTMVCLIGAVGLCLIREAQDSVAPAPFKFELW